MRVVLWDTRRVDAAKDQAGGFGRWAGPRPGGLLGRLLPGLSGRQRRPVPLVYAHLAAAFRRLGHDVRYAVDHLPPDADLYVFCPSLPTLTWERPAIARAAGLSGGARVLVVGTVASLLPEVFAGLDATLVKGEPEQLLWCLDEVLARPGATVQLGLIDDLDKLPPPDWSPFDARRFRLSDQFTRFPTALVESSRGCSLGSGYCPVVALDGSVRLRSPEAVVEEILEASAHWGFRSFHFRDPMFGLGRSRLFHLAELLGRLPTKIQFSLETRPDLMRPEMLRVLCRVGLTALRVGVERPPKDRLSACGRAPVGEDRQRGFFALCRSLNVRTIAEFLVGLPDDTEESIRGVLAYARSLGPTLARFHVLIPYPGTEWFAKLADRLAGFPFPCCDDGTAALTYEHLTAARVEALAAECRRQFAAGAGHLGAGAARFPAMLARLGLGRERPAPADADAAHSGPPPPLSGADLAGRSRRLRQDGPHAHPGPSGPTSDRPR